MTAAGTDSGSGVGVEQVAQWLRQARTITVLTGAGISTESGIPDYRGPNGVWTKNPEAEKRATIQAYLSDPEVRVQVWRARRDHAAWKAEPNAGHLALVELARSGRLVTIVTQNIDGLHQQAGSDPGLVIEMHGTLYQVGCLDCGERTPTEQTLARLDAGEDDPSCLRCGGILKTATISFGQSLDQSVLRR